MRHKRTLFRSGDGTAEARTGLLARSFVFVSLAVLLAGTTVHYANRPLVSAAWDQSAGSASISTAVDQTQNFAIDFNGTNSYVTFGPASKLGAQVFTLEAWIRRDGRGIGTNTGTDGLTGAVPIVTKGMFETDNSNADMNYFLGLSFSSGVLVADFEDRAGGKNHPVLGNTPIPADGQWHHVAATFDGTNWRLFLDGHQDGALTVGAFIPRDDSIQHAAIGTALNSTGGVGSQPQGFFNGVIDEVRIWGVARGPAEIQAGMSTDTPSGPGLLGRWGLNEGSGGAGTTIANTANPAVAGTAQGTFTWVGGAPFTPANTAPMTPVLVAPADGAEDVQVPATLSVSVADPDADPLTVTYYGRPKSAATRPDFAVVAIPDTQHYAASAALAPTFTAQTTWIANNVAPLNIRFVSHLGDIVTSGDKVELEWQRADQSMTVLDIGGVPYGVSPGDHDQAPTGLATMFDKYFSPARFFGREWYGGFLGAEPTDPAFRLNKDSYQLFSAGGMDFLVIHIEHDWPGYAVTWASRLLKNFPNRRVILSSHLFLNESGSRPTTAVFRGVNGTSAEAVWQNLIRTNCNVFLVISGHYLGESRRTDLNACGQPVHQVVSNYQFRPDGGNGWLRYYVFKPSENKIAAFTYSPTLGEFERDADSEFELDFDMGGAGFAAVATRTNVSSGSESTATWPGLEADTAYEWFATVSDGRRTTRGPTWSFTTAPANVAPVALDDSYDVDEDTVLSVAAPGVLGNDTDADGPALTAAVGVLPSNGKLVLDPDGGFTYAPNPGFNGLDSFIYTASDGIAASNVATVTIRVAPVNDAPLAVSDSYAVDEDQTLAVGPLGVLGNDSDEDGGALTAVLVAAPGSGALTLGEDGGFSYTPNRDFSGTDTFSYEANDGQARSNVATVTVTVAAVNDAPVAQDDSYSTDEDTTLNVTAANGVLSNDTDVDGALSALLVAGPHHGTLAFNADGSFTYQPSADFNGGDSFSYRATDGTADSRLATVSLTARPVNDAPIASSRRVTTEMERAVAITLIVQDPEGDALSYRIVSGPTHGTLSGVAPNLEYTPKKKFLGADHFIFVGHDGAADSNLATVSIAVVKEIIEPPVAYDQSLVVDEDARLEFELDAKDPGGKQSLTYQIVTRPAHGRLSTSGRQVEYTPNRDFNGQDSFTFRASNKGHESNLATVSISVIPVNDQPRAVGQEFEIPRGQPLSARLQAADVDGDPLTYELREAPRAGIVTIDEATGHFTYTPVSSLTGDDDEDEDRFAWVASDGKVHSDRARVNIEIDGVAYDDDGDD